MTAMLIIASNNNTLQSLRRHSCLHLLQRQNNGGRMTANSGRVSRKTLVSINSHGRGQKYITQYITLPRICEQLDLRKSLLFMGIEKKHWGDFYH